MLVGGFIERVGCYYGYEVERVLRWWLLSLGWGYDVIEGLCGFGIIGCFYIWMLLMDYVVRVIKSRIVCSIREFGREVFFFL